MRGHRGATRECASQVLQRALAGGEDEQRLVCALYCLAASQILDRFYDLVATYAPEAQLMLSHARAGEDGSPSVSARWAGLADSVGRTSMSGRLRATAAAEEVRGMWTAARTCMREGELLLLRAGEEADVAGSAVLVKGSVRRGGGGAAAVRGDGGLASVLAPCVLLWADFEHEGPLHVQAGAWPAAASLAAKPALHATCELGRSNHRDGAMQARAAQRWWCATRRARRRFETRRWRLLTSRGARGREDQ